MKFIEELKKRKLVAASTPGIEKIFEKGTTLYLGIDPTADSLHIGHFLPLSVLKRALQYNNKIIIIMGGGTALIGDPSGKEKERPILPKEILEKNKQKLKKQIEKFFKVDGKNVKIIDNADWLGKITLIEFLRDAGKVMSVNSMLDLEFVRRRIENKEFLSFAEFTYQLLQAYDFYVLFTKEDCEVQIGGSDQWGNIVQGIELIKRKTGKKAYGLGLPLITDPTTGKKFGKTASGKPIWLDPKKTSPFEFYQFLLNTSDDLARQLLYFYSFRPLSEIEEIINKALKSPEERIAQKELAFELTSLIHGKEAAKNCVLSSKILFSKPLEEISEKEVEIIKKVIPFSQASKKDSIEELLIKSGLAPSKKQARRLLEQKAIKVKRIRKYAIVKKGKKNFGFLELK